MSRPRFQRHNRRKKETIVRERSPLGGMTLEAICASNLVRVRLGMPRHVSAGTRDKTARSDEGESERPTERWLLPRKTSQT